MQAYSVFKQTTDRCSHCCGWEWVEESVGTTNCLWLTGVGRTWQRPPRDHKQEADFEELMSTGEEFALSPEHTWELLKGFL